MGNTKSIGVAYSDQDIDGGTIGATIPATVVGTTVYATTEIGYTASAQGTVTQAASKSTGVTLNRSAGRITMNAEALAGGAVATFTLTNSTISANDTMIVCISSVTTGSTAAAYTTYVCSLTAGSAVIALRNLSATSYSEAVVINFSLIHGQS
jgi:hypothetical protein